MNKSLFILVFIFSSVSIFGQKFQKVVIENMDGSTKTGLVNGKSLSDSKEIKFKTDENSKVEPILKSSVKSIDFYSSNDKIYHIDNIFLTNEKKTKTTSEWMLKLISGYYDLYIIADYSFDKQGNLTLSTDYRVGRDLPEFYYFIKKPSEKYADIFALYSPSPTYFGLHKILKESVTKFMSDDKALVDKVEKKKLSTKNIEQIVKEYNEYKSAN
ncbi:hypothetical protein [Epilithonimonas sp. UC225_85]|uniref:hypothetical protein n=1 Tax=Epilithonimonas sp. UC225_85 TaxID=3350167 RepID=UPI0036D43BC7